MPCMVSFFDAMSGVKKLTKFILAITCQTSVNESSILIFYLVQRRFE